MPTLRSPRARALVARAPPVERFLAYCDHRRSASVLFQLGAQDDVLCPLRAARAFTGGLSTNAYWRPPGWASAHGQFVTIALSLSLIRE